MRKRRLLRLRGCIRARDANGFNNVQRAAGKNRRDTFVRRFR